MGQHNAPMPGSDAHHGPGMAWQDWGVTWSSALYSFFALMTMVWLAAASRSSALATRSLQRATCRHSRAASHTSWPGQQCRVHITHPVQNTCHQSGCLTSSTRFLGWWTWRGGATAAAASATRPGHTFSLQCNAAAGMRPAGGRYLGGAFLRSPSGSCWAGSQILSQTRSGRPGTTCCNL